jgi:hypothetical protein
MSLYFVISTCTGYENILDNVLPSVPKNAFLIIVTSNSNRDDYEIISEKLINVYLSKNLYEYTAWLGIDFLLKKSIVSPDSWFLFTHDTSLFTPESGNKIRYITTVLHRTPINFYSLLRGGFHNICLCRNPAIKKIANHLKTIESMTKDEARNLECKLPTLLESNEIGEYAIPSVNSDEEIMPGKKTTIITSVGILKFYN